MNNNDLTINTTKKYSFSDTYWNDFLIKTENLSKTTVFPNSMDTGLTEELREYTLDILRTLATMRTNKHGYRVYLEGKVLNEEQMKWIYDSPPIEGEKLLDWVERVFGKSKFGMIINEGERFNLALSKKMAVILKPLIDKTGFSNEGINFSIFIGNYGWTPLGIHQDSPGESVTHFHLGPGPKIMYTWSKEVFENLVDIKNFDNKDVLPLISSAVEHHFKEGDLYYMPTGEYHIGFSDQLSLSITVWTYNHTKSRFARRIHSLIADQFCTSCNTLCEPDKSDIKNQEVAFDLLSTFDCSEAMLQLSYKDLFSEMYTDLRYCIASNAGYRTSPFPMVDQKSVVFANDTVILEKPFEMLFRKSIDNEKLYIYIRGHKLSVNYFIGIESLISKINTGYPFLAIDLARELSEHLSEDVTVHLLTLFYKHHGVAISRL